MYEMTASVITYLVIHTFPMPIYSIDRIWSAAKWPANLATDATSSPSQSHKWKMNRDLQEKNGAHFPVAFGVFFFKKKILICLALTWQLSHRIAMPWCGIALAADESRGTERREWKEWVRRRNESSSAKFQVYICPSGLDAECSPELQSPWCIGMSICAIFLRRQSLACSTAQAANIRALREINCMATGVHSTKSNAIKLLSQLAHTHAHHTHIQYTSAYKIQYHSWR